MNRSFRKVHARHGSQDVHDEKDDDDEDQDLSEYKDLQSVAPGQSQDLNEHHDEIKHQLNQGLHDIKKHLNERKTRYKQELSDRISLIEKMEKELSNISGKCSDRWRKIQKKIWFISLLRRVLRNARNFGIDPRKLPEVTEEAKEAKRRISFVIYPDSIFSRVHIVIMLFIMVYLVILFPLDLAFNLDEHSHAWSIADKCITGYFFLDIIVSFVSAYEHNGVLVDNLPRIACNYLSKWFVLDLITVIPFELFVDLDNFQYRRLLKLPRLMRLINSMFQNTESKRKTRSLVIEKLKLIFSSSNRRNAFVSLIAPMMFFHIMACLWIFLAQLEEGYSWMNS